MSLSRATVLLVEDDPNDALLLGFAFRENPLDVHIQQVCDGHAAIAYLQGTGRYANRNLYSLPGLVVLDLHRPGVRGRALLRWMRKQHWLAGLPVVMLGDEDGTPLDKETVTIKRRDTTDLIYLLANVNLGWAANSARVTEAPPCSTLQYSLRPGRLCRSAKSRFAVIQRMADELRVHQQ
jgi:CheY-like chemotaxis protein